RVDRCLRLVHSIKGDAGFLGYTAIRDLANAMETVLEAIREGDGPVPAAAVERLLTARDRLAALVDDPDQSGTANLGELLAQLERVERSIAGSSSRWDIDLREMDRTRQGQLAGFFAAFARLGTVTAPEVVLGETDLARGLPTGPVRFRAKLATSASGEEVR